MFKKPNLQQNLLPTLSISFQLITIKKKKKNQSFRSMFVCVWKNSWEIPRESAASDSGSESNFETSSNGGDFSPGAAVWVGTGFGFGFGTGPRFGNVFGLGFGAVPIGGGDKLRPVGFYGEDCERRSRFLKFRQKFHILILPGYYLTFRGLVWLCFVWEITFFLI